MTKDRAVPPVPKVALSITLIKVEDDKGEGPHLLSFSVKFLSVLIESRYQAGLERTLA